MENRIEIFKQDMKFSSAHFTIFSSTKRESIHGHNYYFKISTELKQLINGMAFDYRDLKQAARALAKDLDEKLLVPQNSKYLIISEEGESLWIEFNKKKMFLQKDDVCLLPIENTTIECLGNYLLKQILKSIEDNILNNISDISLTIWSSPGQEFTTRL